MELYNSLLKWVGAGMLILIMHSSLQAITLVYNLRVRRTFTASLMPQAAKPWILFSAVPIFYARTSHIVDAARALDVCEDRKAGGSLFNVRYVPTKNWWLDATTGLETDSASFMGTDPFHGSRVGFDDFVFSAGYRHFIGHGQVVGYGLAGIPSRRKVDLEDRYGPFVGTRFYNLGFGFEGSYSFLDSPQRSFAGIVQQRFIHAFNRCWAPILPANNKIQPGNFTDLFFVLQWRERFNMVEAGYDATWFTNQAVITPVKKIKSSSFVRNAGFISFSHGWLQGLWDKPCIVGVGFNGSSSKKFNAKTITAWIYGMIAF